MSAIPCFISLWLAAGSPALECSSGAGCREHDRRSERVIVDVPRVDVPRRHDANHPPGWAARNRDSARPTRKAPPRRSRAFVFAISYAVFGGPSQVRAVASTVVASPPFWFPLSMRGPAVLATCAQEICVSNNTEKKEVVSDKCHKVRFYFRHVRHTER